MLHDQIRISANFKKYTYKAMFAIVLFLIVYILLALCSILLSISLLQLSWQIIRDRPEFGSILLGVMISSLGILTSIFLFKFIFSSNKYDRSELTEVDIETEPRLKTLIEEIVDQVETDFPKKIYFSKEVNASVFYDSTFWSMFLPIRKNLEIGIGLVNSVSEEELKAILAHEFGHFSQKSMKVGSYVYNVNRVIFNLLYENNSFNKLVSYWSGIHPAISIAVWLVVQIIRFIQWMLEGIYGLINKAHSGMSIEMEYHADEIAANISGSQPLADSLLRLDLANHALYGVLNFYEKASMHNLKSMNIFEEQKWIIGFYAKQDKLPVKNGLPLVTIDFLDKFNQSKLVIKDQWASHPATKDRVARLNALNKPILSPKPNPANEVVMHIQKYQEIFTAKVFEGFQYADNVDMSMAVFQSKYAAQYASNTFDSRYNAYYDSKNLSVFDIGVSCDGKIEDWGQLYSNEMVNKVYELKGLEMDTATLAQIAEKKSGIKSFDYEGVKYKRKQSKALLLSLHQLLEMKKNEIKQNDETAFCYFKNLEKEQSLTPRLSGMYQSFFDFDKSIDDWYQLYADMYVHLEFINYNQEPDTILKNLSVVAEQESRMKYYLSQILTSSLVQKDVNEKRIARIESYINGNLHYFVNGKYNEEGLKMLFTSLEDYLFILDRYYFLRKKEILDYQVQLAFG